MAKERKRNALDIAKEKVTKLVLEELEKGTAIWTCPWVMQSAHHGFRGKAYTGINILITAMAQDLMGYKSTAWLTWTKLEELQKTHPDIRLKKGSKAVEVVYWLEKEIKDEDGNVILDANGDPETYWKPKFYNVWNADCFENLIPDEFERKDPLPSPVLATLDEKEKNLLSLYTGHPEVLHDGLGKAFYSIPDDKVHLPLWKDFRNEAHAYSTLCHELVHSTGAEGRLKRRIDNTFGSEKYSYEELVAEIGASLLSAEAGYLEQTVENTAAYLESWASVLTNNKNWFWDAFADAKKAVEMILGTRRQKAAAKSHASDEMTPHQPVNALSGPSDSDRRISA